jgi:hypothetical protein
VGVPEGKGFKFEVNPTAEETGDAPPATDSAIGQPVTGDRH